MVECKVEQPDDLALAVFPHQVRRRATRIHAAALIPYVRILPRHALPRVDIRMQIGQHEADGRQILLAQMGVDGAGDGRRGAAGAGAEVDKGVRREGGAEVADEQRGGDAGGGAAAKGGVEVPDFGEGVLDARAEEGREPAGESVGRRDRGEVAGGELAVGLEFAVGEL